MADSCFVSPFPFALLLESAPFASVLRPSCTAHCSSSRCPTPPATGSSGSVGCSGSHRFIVRIRLFVPSRFTERGEFCLCHALLHSSHGLVYMPSGILVGFLVTVACHVAFPATGIAVSFGLSKACLCFCRRVFLLMLLLVISFLMGLPVFKVLGVQLVVRHNVCRGNQIFGVLIIAQRELGSKSSE